MPLEPLIFRASCRLTPFPTSSGQQEYKLDSKGFVLPSRGASTNVDPTVPSVASRGARQIKTIPETLQIKQAGPKDGKTEIVPKQPGTLTPEQFQAELHKVTFYD
jgi:hypothetical protein